MTNLAAENLATAVFARGNFAWHAATHWHLLLIVFGAIGAAPLPAAEREGKIDVPAEVAADWDAAFTRQHGWTGGDVAGTISLDERRTLWLFGDSWIGDVADGRHRPGSTMVGNAVAVQTREHSTDQPTGQSLQFYWGQANDQAKPTAWISPDAGQLHPQRPAGEERTGDRFWPTGGGVVVPRSEGGRRLLVFLFHVDEPKNHGGVWGFRHLRGVLASSDDFSGPADAWKFRQSEIPHSRGAEDLPERSNRDGKLKAGPRNTSWGLATLLQSADAATPGNSTQPGTLYIYGIRDQSPLNRQLLLARVPADAVEKFDQWQFYAGADRWSPLLDEAAPVAEGLSSELSVEAFTHQGRRQLALAYSEPLFGSRVLIRTATHPEGPWSKALAVFDVPEIKRNDKYFTYAAKGHLSLSPPGELLITYLVNAHEFGPMFNDATIYRPRFICVSLGKLAAATVQ